MVTFTFKTTTGLDVSIGSSGTGKILMAVDDDAFVLMPKDAKDIGTALKDLGEKMIAAERDH